MTVLSSRNFSIFADGYDSTGGFVSRAINLGTGFQYSITATFTGSPSGTAHLEGSNDYGENGTAPSNFVLINDPKDTTVTISSAGSVVWAVTKAPYKWARVVYAGSGSSTVGVRGNVKG